MPDRHAPRQLRAPQSQRATAARTCAFCHLLRSVPITVVAGLAGDGLQRVGVLRVCSALRCLRRKNGHAVRCGRGDGEGKKKMVEEEGRSGV
eukprot:2885931-Rhodomonas_salina.2